ncbi:MAG: exonuclease [Alphaproteobacteria bacterium]|nr:exonuclease [Alphaproteobacteria bacterium]
MWIVVDVEADGPAPGLYSMISFGAVIVEEGDARSFKGETAPITDAYIAEALAVSGLSRAEHEAFPPPEHAMKAFAAWVAPFGRPTFISDNPAFDWQFINYYFHRFTGKNPFGHSARRIGDLYAGLVRKVGAASEWKKLRRTTHTHDPVDDARGNVEALFAFAKQYDLKLPSN